MPRVETQTIPPALLADYNKNLGPTGYLQHNFGKKTAQRSSVQAHYTAHPAQANRPSSGQRAERSIFRAACSGWELTTTGERKAYWQAAQESAEPYYNFFMRRTLDKMIAGEHWPTIARPVAIRLNPFPGYGPARAWAYTFDHLPHNITFEIEAGPCTFSPGFYPNINDPLVIYAWGWNEFDDPPINHTLVYDVLTPAGLNQEIFTRSYDLAAYDLTYWGFYRSSITTKALLIWKYTKDTVQGNLTLENFSR